MNHSYCYSHKKTPYKLVYGNKSQEDSTLIKELFNKNIYDEESIPKTIKIKDLEDIVENLDDDIIYGQGISFLIVINNLSKKNYIIYTVIFFLFSL